MDGHQDSIEELAQVLSTWRLSKKSRYERIPKELRERALSLVGRYPKAELIRKLGLTKYFFAKVEIRERQLEKKDQFVCIPPTPSAKAATSSTLRCDLEFPNGLRLRIY